ncbi:DNA repair helicase [Ramicandelaber brevisporus]|nr:DNA repair helicase [Ramicandelaber brevisporus]
MTILGIGVDILHIPRLTALLSRGTVHRNRRFIERICSQYDHQLLQTRFSHLADPATSIDVSNTAMVMHLAKVDPAPNFTSTFVSTSTRCTRFVLGCSDLLDDSISNSSNNDNKLRASVKRFKEQTNERTNDDFAEDHNEGASHEAQKGYGSGQVLSGDGQRCQLLGIAVHRQSKMCTGERSSEEVRNDITRCNGKTIDIEHSLGKIGEEDLDGLPVRFPYDYIYPEQYQYMCDLKRALDSRGHCMLEMPSGTGKTVTLLSLILSYQQHHNDNRKLVYCSRTVPEIDKALAELQRLVAYRKENGCPNEQVMCLGLTARKNLCLHPTVSQEKSGKVIDSMCRNMTASWMRERAKGGDASVELCDYYEVLHRDLEIVTGPGSGNASEDSGDGNAAGSGRQQRLPGTMGSVVRRNANTPAAARSTAILPPGVYTMDDIRDYGREHTMCPYYLARRNIAFANVVIYSYHYLLDPKVAELVSKELSKDCIVVFDEAHNIDNVCLESMSIDISRPNLEASMRSITKLEDRLRDMKQNDADKLRNEYQRLLDGLKEIGQARDEDLYMANPTLPDDIVNEVVPGNIRKADHFVAFLKRFVEYLKMRLRVMHVVAETPVSFLQHVREVTMIEQRPLRFSVSRLTSLVRTLELTDIEEYSALHKIAGFATMVATYNKGFMLLIEPFESDLSRVPNPRLHFVCMDPSLAIKPVFSRFHTVVITSGTLSPMEMYPKMLQFTPTVMASYSMSLDRQCFLPVVVTRGDDQVAISSRFEVRNDPAVVRNFGSLLIELSKSIPDGIVAFFPSYLYMESIVSMWNEMDILKSIWKHKLIFVETPDAAETAYALENYRAACNNGRGAVLLSVARGKVSEGIDFDHNYGRAVIMFGIPYQYTESRILKARLEFLRETYRIRENDYLTFDAMRHAAQCVGRVLRGKTDYGLMVFADKRYARQDKQIKLPRWIASNITDATNNLSMDVAVQHAKGYLRQMAQPLELAPGKPRTSMWSAEDVKAKQAQEKKVREELEQKQLQEENAMEID